MGSCDEGSKPASAKGKEALIDYHDRGFSAEISVINLVFCRSCRIRPVFPAPLWIFFCFSCTNIFESVQNRAPYKRTVHVLYSVEYQHNTDLNFWLAQVLASSRFSPWGELDLCLAALEIIYICISSFIILSVKLY